MEDERRQPIFERFPLTCPSCAAAVPKGTSICPRCDFIIDASFLDGPASTSAGEDDTPPRAVRPPPPPRSSGAASALASPAPVRREAPRRSPRADTPVPTPSPDVQDLPTTSGSTPEDALHDLKDFVVELPAPDKLAFAGLTLSLLLCVFPWKETVQDGDSLGLLTSGALVALASLLGIGALAARDRQLLPRIAPSTLWIAQLMAATFSLIWCGVFIWMSWDSRVARSPIGNFEMPLSRPAAGVYLAVISSALGLYGTLRGLPRE